MTRNWYAVYLNGEISPSAIFDNIDKASEFTKGKNSKILQIPVDSDIVNDKFLLTAFANINPWKKA